MNVKPNFGGENLPLVFKGDKLIYPNYVSEGLALHYDFSGMTNTNTNKEIATDLSGNGNDGQLQNFNFTEQSGYGKNRLLFDGVDDKLQIPELNLVETGMTVGVDGKVYAYEDDKALTVGEGGVVEVSENLLSNSNFTNSMESWRTISVSVNIIDGCYSFIANSTNSRIFYNIINMASLGTVTASLDIKASENSKIRIGENSAAGNDIEVTSNWQRISRVFEGFRGETLSILFQDPSVTYQIKKIKLEVGDNPNPIYSPAPKDYKTTSLSPSSLSNLQLYSRPLLKDELLQNTESEGLKELKEGVPVQNGLVLHYDFSKESNTSEYKSKAFDYSGNGNHGTLQSFNYTAESGYDENKLSFDGVDDYISIGSISEPMKQEETTEYTLESVVRVNEDKRNNLWIDSELIKMDLSGGRVRQTGAGSNVNFYTDLMSKKVHLVYMVKGENGVIYIDGEKVYDQILSSPEDLPNLSISSIGLYVSEGRPNIELWSAKAYNRPLTSEEIAHNYQIEKEKYGLE